MKKLPLVDDHHCFACGMENKEGLRIHWIVEGKRTRAEYIPPKKFQGWKDIVHGGILATLLDEAMTRLSWISSRGALTAEMTVRYLRPAKIGEKILIEGEVTGENRKVVQMRAALYDASRNLLAHSEGKAVKV